MKINDYKTKKFKDSFLITTNHGSFVLLNKKDYNLLKLEKINKKLFKLLEKKGIVITRENKKKIIQDYKNRMGFLFHGTSLHIVVPTLRCNMTCVYCHASSKLVSEKKFDMDKKTAKKTVDFIFQTPSKAITIEIQGGEPLLNFNIVKFIIQYAKKLNKKYKKNVSVVIGTNLCLMDDVKLDYLIKNNVGICTSLDGSKNIHDKNRKYLGGKGSYDDVIKWIKKINEIYENVDKGRRIGALITITRYTLKYPKEVVDEYIKQGITDIHLRLLDNLGDARSVWNKINYSATEFIDFWKKAVDYIIELNKKGGNIRERMATIMLKKILTKIDPGYLDLRSPCGAAIGQLVYDYDGSIYSCDEGRMIGEDVFKLGDVMNDSYKKVLTSNQTCAIISASINDVYICDSCVYKPYCGLCPVCNYVEQGSIITNVPESDRCKIFKAQFDYIFNKLLFDKETKEIFLKWIKK